MNGSNYVLIELKPGCLVLDEDPAPEALAILGQLVIDNINLSGKPVMVRLEGDNQ